MPHPRRHPEGHSYGHPEPTSLPFEPEGWRTCESYRYGVDLYNAGYFWECHEVFEALWRGVGRRSRPLPRRLPCRSLIGSVAPRGKSAPSRI